MQDKVTAKFIITGHVQGVGFRYFIFKHAVELGLTGYAKNLYDGSVETIASGETSKINSLHNYLLNGPSRSYVNSVSIEYIVTPENYSGFDIK